MSLAPLVILALQAPAAPAPRTAPACLRVPEGFAAELVDQAPNLRWPSALHGLSDGSLLVAEDPMDMPGPADQPIDRIWRYVFRPDGSFERTPFADGLYAVFGLQEVDGAVLAMNMPHLTRLVDRDGDGRAEERTVLIDDLGPDAPGWPGGFNDHIVSGIRLGLDGWVYVSVGDKGIPAAHGTDGSTITLRGGGIARVRPDGSRLEIVSSGTRNHLDVVIDERGELFTYDNTDDGLGWWTRVTHHVRHGYYGYPWDYREHPERHLPCMQDFGGGSPTGGVAYLEAAWPEEQRGSLFWCEWGKSALRRIVVEPEGATFRIASDEDFATAGDALDFRPTDVCESCDGRFLFVADWGYPGWVGDEETGRLWRIRRAEDLDLAVRPLRTPTDRRALLAALGDASFRVRLAAQRALERGGEAGALDLARVALESASARARRHALWALASIGGERADAALASALDHADADTRAQALRAWSDRSVRPTAAILRRLGDAEAVVRREAANALPVDGGVDGERVVEGVFIGEGDRFVRWAQRAALRRIDSWIFVAGHFWGTCEHGHPEELNGILHGMYSERALGALDSLFTGGCRTVEHADGRRSTPDSKINGLRIASQLYKMPEPWDGKWWKTQPAQNAPPPNVVPWAGTEKLEAAVASCLEDEDPRVARAALEAVREMRAVPLLERARAAVLDPRKSDGCVLLFEVMADLQDAGAAPAVHAVLNEARWAPEVCLAAVRCASRIAVPEMVEELAGALSREDLAAELRVECIEGLGRLRRRESAAAVEAQCERPEPAVRAAAARALGRIRSEETAPRLERLLEDPVAEVRRAAAEALGDLGLSSAVPALMKLVGDDELRATAIQALARKPDERALDAYLAGLSAKDLAVQGPSRAALRRIRCEVRSELEERCAGGELAPESIAILREIYAEGIPVLDWRILGPLARTKDAAAVDLEALLDPRASPVGKDGDPLEWVEHRAEPGTGFVDLRQVLAEENHCDAFAAASLPPEVEREARLFVGSDDRVRVWIDGALVHDFEGIRGWTEDEDEVAVKLSAGQSQVLVQVGNVTGGWSFNVKLSPPATGPLFEGGLPAAPALEDYRRRALEGAGDPERGWRVFADSSRTACTRCHVVQRPEGPLGERVGPDLSDIGARYDGAEIVRSLLEPSARIAEGYRSWRLVLEDESVVYGQILAETARELVVVEPSGQKRAFDPAQVAERSESRLSLMPEGLPLTMTPEEFADLAAFLGTLRGAREP